MYKDPGSNHMICKSKHPTESSHALTSISQSIIIFFFLTSSSGENDMTVHIPFHTSSRGKFEHHQGLITTCQSQSSSSIKFCCTSQPQSTTGSERIYNQLGPCQMVIPGRLGSSLSTLSRMKTGGSRLSHRRIISRHPSISKHKYADIIEHINIEVLNQINYSYNKQSYPGKH